MPERDTREMEWKMKNIPERKERGYGRILAATPVWLASVLMGMLSLSGSAFAALTINSVTLNGGASVTVASGATISVVVSETNTTNSNWGSTRVRTNPTTVTTCVDTPDHNGNGTFSEAFTITAPAAAGTYDASIRAYTDNVCGGTSSATVTLAGGIVVVAAPAVTAITPGSGPLAGGTAVTITGTDFTGVTAVTIGGVAVTGMTVVNATTITATTPAGTQGARDVVVTAVGGTGTGIGLFTYVAAPTVTTNAATGVTSSGATLNGTVSSNGGATAVSFEYGLTNAYGSSIAATPGSLAAGATNSAVTASLTGLVCETLYHFRVRGANSAGTSNGIDRTFTTSTCPPPVVTLGKTAGTSAAAVGSYVTYTLTATNSTAVALNNVVLTDVIPASMTYTANAATLGTVAVAAQTLTWTIPYLPAGSGAQLTLVVRPTLKGSYTNTVTSPGAVSASADILILPSAITRYSMDEAVGSWTGAAGEVIDSGGNGLNGQRLTTTVPTTTNTIAPNPTIASQHASVQGGFCNAGRFDGNAVVQSASSTYFQFTNQLSASAWIYPTAYPAGASDLYSILSNDTNYEFHLDPGGHLYWWWQAANLTSASVIPLNAWTHVAITFDSTAANRRQRIYINGVLDANTNNWSGTLAKNACPFYIGGDISTSSPQTNPPTCNLLPVRNFHGNIDEAKIYDYELTSAEVQADMNLGRLCGASSFDHIQIEHDGTASTCYPKTVTVKACMNASCSSLYPGTVTVHLSPTGWTPSDIVTINGGVATATLSNSVLTGGTNVTLGTTSVSPTPANTTTCFNGATASCTLVVPPSAATSCGFDAAEVGANPQSHLYTKLVGTAFNVDVLAVGSPPTTVDTTKNSTVSVDLVDTSGAACTGSSTALNTAQAVNLVAGRRTVSMSSATACPNARVRIRVGSAAPYTYACSYDALAVRPASFTVTSTDATNNGTTGTPAIKAGTAFNLTAASVPGYNGTPVVDVNNVTGTAIRGALGGSFTAAPAASGTAVGNGFTYGEVGNFGLNQNAVTDASFTLVDQAPGDCVAGSFSNALDVGGRYGCSIGSVAVPQTTNSSGFGRFIPDHFDTAIAVVAGVPMACPNGLTCPCLSSLGCLPAATGFVYSGQNFATQVTARNLAGGTTQNYAGNYARNVTLSAWDTAGGTGTQNPFGALTNNSIANTVFGLGIATTTSNRPIYTLSTTQTAPTDIYIRADEPVGADGVSSRRTTNPTTTSVEGGVKVLNGRIKVSNAYGSELLPLTLTATAQYYTATGWVNSLTDGVTRLALTYAGTLTPTPLVTLNPASGVISGGSLTISIAAPGAGRAGTVTATPAIDTASPGNPGLMLIPGTASFGIYKNNSGFIYRRESY